MGPGSRVGEFCILNTGSSIDHDCILHDFSSIAPGVSTGGLVEIGECSAIGVGASISDRISIGRHAVVGTGAVVVRDIPDLVVAYGNPARVQRSRPEGEKYVESDLRAARLGWSLQNRSPSTTSLSHFSLGRMAPGIRPYQLPTASPSTTSKATTLFCNRIPTDASFTIITLT